MHDLGEAARIWVYIQVFEKLFYLSLFMVIIGIILWGKKNDVK